MCFLNYFSACSQFRPVHLGWGSGVFHTLPPTSAPQTAALVLLSPPCASISRIQPVWGPRWVVKPAHTSMSANLNKCDGLISVCPRCCSAHVVWEAVCLAAVCGEVFHLPGSGAQLPHHWSPHCQPKPWQTWSLVRTRTSRILKIFLSPNVE